MPTSLRERQKEQTRLEMVRSAYDLFVRDGYDEVSMDAISEAAGVSRATLFNYFPRKELILPEIARLRVERLKEFARQRTDERPATVEEMLAFILQIAREHERIARGHRRLMMQVWFQQATHGYLLERRAEAVEALGSMIERMPRRKKLFPARVAAEMVFAVVMATALEWMMNEKHPVNWLSLAMEQRLSVAFAGVA